MDMSQPQCGEENDEDMKSQISDDDDEAEINQVQEEKMPAAEGGMSASGSAEHQEKPQSDVDLYAYLQRDEFTSEIYKIEINNLPRKFGIAQLRKKLIALGLKPSKIKIMQTGSYAFVNFKCEEDRQEAITKLEGTPWKGKNLKVKKANPAADPLLKKRKLQAADAEEPDDSQKKVLKVEEESDKSRAERLNDIVSTLWKMPYEDQLKTKEKEVHNFLKRLGREISKTNRDPDMQTHLRDMFRLHRGLCCEVLPIKPSPILNGYRNKSEVTIGQSHDGTDKVVGFRLGSYKQGTLCVVEPEECVIISDTMKACCKSLQHFLRTESSQPGFEPESKSGNWMMAVLRTNRRDDAMMIVVFHPQRLSSEEIVKEREKLKKYYLTGEGRHAPLKSLYFSVQSDRRNHTDEPVYEHLTGSQHLEEDLLDMKFRISPGAFFQVNTLAAEVLYQTIGDWCGTSSDTVLLDVCCGTGTIGLTLAKHVKKVVGIEMCKAAIDDAKYNAKINNVENTEYYCDKAETILPNLMWRYCREQVVAVVDPPRAGLHADVIRSMRKSDFVQRLVYVSCKATGALTNLLDLTRPESKRVRGAPFKLIKAVPVDLFPHTAHSELVMLFERPAPEPRRSGVQQPQPNDTKPGATEPSVTIQSAAEPSLAEQYATEPMDTLPNATVDIATDKTTTDQNASEPNVMDQDACGS